MLLESDGGIFDPEGFGYTGPAPSKATVTAITSLLKSIGADKVRDGGGGADIGPSGTAGNVPMFSHLDEANYFQIHHTPADTVESVMSVEDTDAASAVWIAAVEPVATFGMLMESWPGGS